jgi:hypothetical protein
VSELLTQAKQEKKARSTPIVHGSEDEQYGIALVNVNYFSTS